MKSDLCNCYVSYGFMSEQHLNATLNILYTWFIPAPLQDHKTNHDINNGPKKKRKKKRKIQQNGKKTFLFVGGNSY